MINLKDKNILKFIEKARVDADVLAIALFGSMARGEPHRDIDLCIFLNRKMTNKEMTDKRIKYLNNASDKLDIHIFQQLPVYIRVRILKEGKILFCNDEDSLYEIAFDIIKEFNLYEKVYNMCLGGVENG
ncbi:MAG: nucleotidyltransferase domain-containing protein [Nanoarchaeota archaeon]